MRENFVEPTIEVRELCSVEKVMDTPMLISKEPGTESRFIADSIISNYSAWKGKQR